VATEFVVIDSVRQHFGLAKDTLIPGVPFKGAKFDYPFQCQNVDASSPAVLMFEAYHADNDANSMKVNGSAIAGGIPADHTGDARGWSSHTVLIGANVLKNGNNALHVEVALNNQGEAKADFIIDNVVLLYKTKTGTATPFPGGNTGVS
jgi:hypothetical protein